MHSVASVNSVVLSRGWLSRTPEPFQRAVLKRCLLRKYKSGAAIFRKGDAPGGLFGIVRGGVAVDVATAEREVKMAYFLRPGAWFGGAPAFTGQPRRTGFRATRATELLHLPLHAINAIVAEDAAAWRCFALIGFVNLEVAISVCEDLMIRDHTRRFVAMLLQLAGCRDATPPESEPIDVDIGQAELATMAVVARNTAGIILRRLARAGYIDTSYRRIRIVAPDLLRQMLVRRTKTSRNRRLAQADFELVDLAAKAKRPAVEVTRRHRRA